MAFKGGDGWGYLELRPCAARLGLNARQQAELILFDFAQRLNAREQHRAAIICPQKCFGETPHGPAGGHEQSDVGERDVASQSTT